MNANLVIQGLIYFALIFVIRTTMLSILTIPLLVLGATLLLIGVMYKDTTSTSAQKIKMKIYRNARYK